MKNNLPMSKFLNSLITSSLLTPISEILWKIRKPNKTSVEKLSLPSDVTDKGQTARLSNRIKRTDQRFKIFFPGDGICNQRLLCRLPSNCTRRVYMFALCFSLTYGNFRYTRGRVYAGLGLYYLELPYWFPRPRNVSERQSSYYVKMNR